MRYDYADLERRYIEGDASLRSLARETGMSNSTISAYARGHAWPEKRALYRGEPSVQASLRDYGLLVRPLPSFAFNHPDAAIGYLLAVLRDIPTLTVLKIEVEAGSPGAWQAVAQVRVVR